VYHPKDTQHEESKRTVQDPARYCQGNSFAVCQQEGLKEKKKKKKKMQNKNKKKKKKKKKKSICRTVTKDDFSLSLILKQLLKEIRAMMMKREANMV
jgi:hypothetical protein